MDLTEEITGLNDEINRLFTGFSVDLDALFEMLLSGNVSGALQMCFQNLAQAFQGEIKSFKSMIVMLLCVGILAALLMNLTDLFENKQIADIGFYFVYLFLILLLLRIFGVVTDTAQVLISDMLVFMKLFMPVYFLAVGAAGGVTTVLLYYQFILTVIYVMEAALSAFLMPLSLYSPGIYEWTVDRGKTSDDAGFAETGDWLHIKDFFCCDYRYQHDTVNDNTCYRICQNVCAAKNHFAHTGNRQCQRQRGGTGDRFRSTD